MRRAAYASVRAFPNLGVDAADDLAQVDNADARSRGARRATAAVFRRYMLKPVGEPYDSTVAYIKAHYVVDGRMP